MIPITSTFRHSRTDRSEKGDGSTEDDMELIVYNGALRGEIWEVTGSG